MKDDSPRIFRSLETSAGREGFDTIVGAAVASYSALRTPSEHQARDFGRLVVPLWDKISAETRRSLSAALSSSPRVPRAVVEFLIAEPIEISAPFLMSSPALGEADLKALALSRDRRLRKLVAGRARPIPPGIANALSDLSEAEAPVSREADSPTPRASQDAKSRHMVSDIADHTTSRSGRFAEPTDDRAGWQPEPASQALRPSPFERHTAVPVVKAPPLVPDLDIASDVPHREADRDATPRGPAALVRETLRRLALSGRSQPAAGAAPSLRELVALAVQQDAARFYEGLSRKLGIGAETSRRIADDESGELLAIAIKALGAGAADALTMLMMIKPAIGLDVGAFDRMTRTYRALKPADCAALLGTPALADDAARSARPQTFAPTHQSQYQDLDPLPRAEPRPTFGRRKTRPGEMEKGSKAG